jgi:hypothetical protein
MTSHWTVRKDHRGIAIIPYPIKSEEDAILVNLSLDDATKIVNAHNQYVEEMQRQIEESNWILGSCLLQKDIKK